MRTTPIKETVQAMWQQKKIKYVGMSMRSNFMYLSQFAAKYGKSLGKQYVEMVLRPDALALDSQKFGPTSSDEGQNLDYGIHENAKLKSNIEALVETYRGSQSYTDYTEWLKSNEVSPGKTQLSLIRKYT